MNTRTLLAIAFPAALLAWGLAPAPETPEPTPAQLEDDEEWSRTEQEEFMCQIGYVQC